MNKDIGEMNSGQTFPQISLNELEWKLEANRYFYLNFMQVTKLVKI